MLIKEDNAKDNDKDEAVDSTGEICKAYDEIYKEVMDGFEEEIIEIVEKEMEKEGVTVFEIIAGVLEAAAPRFVRLHSNNMQGLILEGKLPQQLIDTMYAAGYAVIKKESNLAVQKPKIVT